MKKNNKGFSLVELIIVIAIIAILAAVLAPQFIRFLEDGRESNDVSIATNLETAINTLLASQDLQGTAGTVEWNTTTGELTVTGITSGFGGTSPATTAAAENLLYTQLNVAGATATSTSVPDLTATSVNGRAASKNVGSSTATGEVTWTIATSATDSILTVTCDENYQAWAD